MRSTKKSLILHFILLLLFTGCSDGESSKAPDNVINESQMIGVLTDICTVEARFQRRLTTTHVSNTEMVLHNYNVVFEAHDITLTQFKDSYAYYEETPEQMQQIFDSVIVRLTEKQALLKQKESGST